MPVPAFPADDPIWNTSGTNRTTPTALKQAAGWDLNEEPPSGYFNWWMFYVSEYIQHYKTSVAALDSEKVAKAGDTMTGLLSANGGVSLLNATLELSGTSIFSVQNGTSNVSGDLVPLTNGVRSLGINAFRWNAYINKLYAAQVAETIVADGVAGVSLVDVDLGSEQLPFFRVVANQIVAKNIGVLRSSQPAANDDLAQLNQLTMVLARGKIVSTSAPSITNANAYNRDATGMGANAVRVGPGNFYVDLAVPITSDATCIATPSAAAAPDHRASCAIVSGGSRVQITLRDSAGTLVDGTVSYVVLGFPSPLVTDSILENP